MKYIKIERNSIANGPGIRVVLWVSGCEHHCKNCHNQETWNKNKGLDFNNNAEKVILDELNKSYISGITFSGGDPLAPYNKKEVIQLAKKIKNLYPNKTIWCYTGYKYEDFSIDELQYFDILVDGEFIEELKDISLQWRGSSNQRIIDIKEVNKIGQKK